MVFNESLVRLTELTTTLTYLEKEMVNDPLYKIKFNKPIQNTDTSKLIYKADSSFNYFPDSLKMNWNLNRTELSLQTFLNKDTIYDLQKRAVIIDSVLSKKYKIDSMLLINPNFKDSIIQVLANRSPIEFHIEEGAFTSVEEDSSSVQKIVHKRNFSSPFGTLKLNLLTEKTSYIVQLVDSKKEVAYEASNNPTPTFDVMPATYSIRILIDSNNDGRWSYGNLLKNIEPEEVYIFKEKIPIRENWIVEDISITF